MKYFAVNQIICTFVYQIKLIKTKSYENSYHFKRQQQTGKRVR